jgi:D-tyrosyl-tRNA(Tyr) deacylase
MDNQAEYASLPGRGLLVFVSFLKQTVSPPPSEPALAIVSKAAKAVLTARLLSTEVMGGGEPCSVTDIGASVMIVPQFSLAGKLKGAQAQYHGGIPKDECALLYEAFCAEIKQGSSGNVVAGVFGNRQGLSFESEGPFTHMLEF